VLTPWEGGRWLLLATLWSLQYIFMRMAVTVFEPVLVADGRALFAALFLVPWMIFVQREAIGLRAHWRDHLAVSMTNNVLPFVCMAYAATGLPASYLAVLNGMVPLWAGIISGPLLKEPLGARQIGGFLLGVVGIALIVRLGPVPLDASTITATAVGMLGAALWGWGGVVIRQRSGRVAPMSLATGSVILCMLILAPAWTSVPPPATWTPTALTGLIALGVLISGVGYLPFFTLVRDIGPTRTLTVGLAVPVLGMLWGWLFLGESITLGMIAGAALVLMALGFVMKR
jgi:drug/metabolite transporter (DMT)-like permease